MTRTAATPPENAHQDLSLPASGWDLHIGRGPHLRPALEVHTGDGLVDVAVAGGRDMTLLRGALRGRRAARPWAVAWGHLPPGAGEITVEFRARRGSRRVSATQLAGAFWVAETPGHFRSVAVAVSPDAGAAPQSATRLRRHRSGPSRQWPHSED
ncbi:MAG: hypothetical protein JWO67_5191 [Streptosporangiaceae bacterium]|jgi:hypothetical protein|nr:hypothetical protein [Streptosporangiaceae bacterium]